MSTDMKLPELGENIEGGDVLRVMVKPGDAIKKDQPVLELETDKATIEVPSSADGVVKEVKIKPGEKVKVGQTIFLIDEAAADGGQKAEGKEQGRRRRAEGRGRRAEGGEGRGAQSGGAQSRRTKGRRAEAGEAQSRSCRDEAVQAGRRAGHAEAGRASEGGRDCRFRHSGRAFGTPSRARARREHSGYSRLRSGRTHLDGRCHRVCAAAAVWRRCGAFAGVAWRSAARLQQMGSGRAQGDERRSPDDRAPADTGVEHRAARVPAGSRGHHAASRRCASGCPRNPKPREGRRSPSRRS